MGENDKKNDDGEQNKGGEKKKKKKDDGGADQDDRVPVVLKTDFHCDGCASKILKFIRSFDGVDSATVADGQKIAVVGDVDAAELRELVERKMRKKVELISAPPRKDKAETKAKDNSGGDKEPKDKSGEKLPPVTTAVFKVHLHCDGCIHKIYKTVTKTKGYEEVKIDGQKDVVTVTGAMDMKALAEVLKKQLKRDVQIVQPKKEEDKKDDKGGVKEADGGAEGSVAVSMPFQFQVAGHSVPYPVNIGSGFMADPLPHHVVSYPSEMFSDENPNACSVM